MYIRKVRAQQKKEGISQRNTSTLSGINNQNEVRNNSGARLETSATKTSKAKKQNDSKKDDSTVQPPCGSVLNVNINSETEDDEHLNFRDFLSLPEQSLDILANVAPPSEFQLEPARESTKPFCRRFALGICTNGSACKYEHNIDPMQQQKVFEFCWDFQNGKCRRYKCKYLHASITEESNFYRTGSLPLHVLDGHDEEKNRTQPSSAPLNEGTRHKYPSQVTSRRRPFTHDSMQTETNTPQYNYAASYEKIQQKYRDIAAPAGPLSDAESYRPRAKKCKNCAIYEARLQANKAKLDAMERSREVMKNKLHVSGEKAEKLCLALMTCYRLRLL